MWLTCFFIQQTRSLAREEFLRKALIRKIAQGMGLTSSERWEWDDEYEQVLSGENDAKSVSNVIRQLLEALGWFLMSCHEPRDEWVLIFWHHFGYLDTILRLDWHHAPITLTDKKRTRSSHHTHACINRNKLVVLQHKSVGKLLSSYSAFDILHVWFKPRNIWRWLSGLKQALFQKLRFWWNTCWSWSA
jgi:hypothetical protein